MDGTMTTGDLALLERNGDWGGNNSFLWIFALLILANGGFGGMFGNRGAYGDATSQEILFNQHFSDLDNKMDRGFTSIGNGISDATFALNNAITNGYSTVAGTVVNEGRAIQDKLCALNTAVHAEGEATRALIQENKIQSLQEQVSELKTAQLMCGVPKINPYAYGVYQYPQAQGCGCAYNAI